MGDRSHVRVLLYLDPDGEVINGTLALSDNERREFFGWLELAHELEAARRSEPHKPRDEPYARAVRR
jgi:hypothetical protein